MNTVDVNSSRITNVTDPSSDQDAATTYVDSVANNLRCKLLLSMLQQTNVVNTYNNAIAIQ